MSRYRFELATEADDADLRRILAQTPMPGRIAVSFCREPSYFAAAVVEGDFLQVVAARDCDADRIVGFGTRSIRRRYVNGRPQPIGYLSNLRLATEHRQGGLVARGYRFFRELHADGRAPLYLTTIAEGNDAALRLLTSGRAGLPAYHYAGDYHTLAIPLARRARVGSTPASLTLRGATAADLPLILAFLADQGPKRQFFPCYTAEDFFTAGGAFRDLEPNDLWLAFRDGRLVGMLGAWDQHGFRQSVVQSYGRAVGWSRPLYNGWARLRGLPVLPAPRRPLRYLVAALPVVADDDATVFRALLEKLLAEARGRAAEYLLLGLHASDPLLPVAREYSTTCYTTRLYFVAWDDGQQMLADLDGRPPYLELGSL